MRQGLVASIAALLLLSLQACSPAQMHGLVYTTGSTVWILDPANLAKRELARGAGYAVGLSHDLHQMAFSKDSHDLWVAGINGENAKQVISDQLTRIGLGINRIAWAPNGRKLAILAVPNENANRHPEEFALYVVDVSAAGVQLIDKGISAFEWTRDGDRLAVLRLFNPDEPAGIFLVDSAGSSWKQLHEGLAEPFLAMSPVKDEAAFVASKSGGGFPDTLFVLNLATGARYDALEKADSLPSCCVGWPIWSVDGNRLAFTAEVPYRDNASITALFVVDARTLAVRKLAEGITAPVAWSPDGRMIAAAGRTSPYGLFKINAETGEMSKLSDDQRLIPFGFEWR